MGILFFWQIPVIGPIHARPWNVCPIKRRPNTARECRGLSIDGSSILAYFRTQNRVWCPLSFSQRQRYIPYAGYFALRHWDQRPKLVTGNVDIAQARAC